MSGDLNRHVPDGPYRDLYIYMINGLVAEREEKTFGETFLGNWVEDNNSCLFFSEPSPDIISDLLHRRTDLKVIDDYHFAYEQWQGDGQKAARIGDFLIVPPWEKCETNEDEIKIVLDPGVVFGSGIHPTTRDCLNALAHLRKEYFFKRVLDLGTGTGILALAAHCLGAEKITAVDLNPLSVKTALKNVKLNHFEEFITVIEGRAEDFAGGEADLLVANIHYEVIKNLVSRGGFTGKRFFIISGLMRSQVSELRPELLKKGLRVIREWDHEMTWYTLLGRYSE